MTVPTETYGAIMLVTYRIRADADEGVYEDWLRRVDNPFFNASPLAERYVNWKIAGNAGDFAPNTYFDLWDMRDASRFDPLRGDPALNAFRAEWHRQWGLGAAGQDNRMQGWLGERVVAVLQVRTPHLILRLGASDTPMEGWQTWKITRAFFGPPPRHPFLQTRFAADADEAAGLVDRFPGATRACVVAAPDR